jgi:hypothetical protein
MKTNLDWADPFETLPEETSNEDEKVSDDERDAHDGAGRHAPLGHHRPSDHVEAQQEDLKQNTFFCNS